MAKAEMKGLTFEVTPPYDDTFYAAVVTLDDKPVVVSTRTGEWALDEELFVEDLLSPMYDLNEWDVTQVDPGEAPAMPTDKGWVV